MKGDIPLRRITEEELMLIALGASVELLPAPGEGWAWQVEYDSSVTLRRALPPSGRAMRRASPRTRVNREVYGEYRRLLWLRSQGRCERPECGAMAQDAHHLKKPRRAYHQYLVALCREDHAWVDAPSSGRRGRLVITLAEHSEEDPMLIVTFGIRGGPKDGWEKPVVLAALVRR